MKGKRIKYGASELVWIEKHKTDDQQIAYAVFWKKFNRDDVSFENYRALCKRKGWFTGRTGHFEKGSTPPNKGRKMPFNANRTRTQFKKGNLPHNIKHLYAERMNSDGYVEISVPEKNPHTGFEHQFVLKHRWEWKKRNGKIPEGYCLKCLDGIKTHTCPTNWKVIPRSMLPRLNGRFGRGFDQAEAEVKPLIMAVSKLEHKARAKRRILS